jgi:hypothetical protein
VPGRSHLIDELVRASLGIEEEDWVTSQDEDELILQLCADTSGN